MIMKKKHHYLTIMMINREKEKAIKGGVKGWRSRYYYTCFSIE